MYLKFSYPAIAFIYILKMFCSRSDRALSGVQALRRAFTTPNITQHAFVYTIPVLYTMARPPALVGSQESFTTPNITQHALYTMCPLFV